MYIVAIEHIKYGIIIITIWPKTRCEMIKFASCDCILYTNNMRRFCEHANGCVTVCEFLTYHASRLESYLKMVIEGKRDCVNVGKDKHTNIRTYARAHVHT